MRRIIKTYETCSDELLGMIAEKFPDGIKPRHLHNLTTIKGERIKVVEIKTEDTMYLIKFSEKLEEAIDNLDIDDDEDDDMAMDDDMDANLAEAEGIPDTEIDLDDLADEDDD